MVFVFLINVFVKFTVLAYFLLQGCTNLAHTCHNAWPTETFSAGITGIHRKRFKILRVHNLEFLRPVPTELLLFRLTKLEKNPRLSRYPHSPLTNLER
jgi:hypothetical protein